MFLFVLYFKGTFLPSNIELDIFSYTALHYAIIVAVHGIFIGDIYTLMFVELYTFELS